MCKFSAHSKKFFTEKRKALGQKSEGEKTLTCKYIQAHVASPQGIETGIKV